MLRQIGHVGKTQHVSVINPPKNLTGTVSPMTMLRQLRYQGFFTEILDVYSFRHKEKELKSDLLGSLLGNDSSIGVNIKKRYINIFLT